MPEQILLTGFEPYGGHSINPTALIVEQLDGERIADKKIVGHVLPVTLSGLAERLRDLLTEAQPVLVLSLGLAAGTPTIRLERIAINLADFDIPDNSGTRCTNQVLIADGPAGLSSTLPLPSMLDALLTTGIPACLSNSAGSYLCNATMYHFLYALRGRNQPPPYGFIHLPYLPEQVAVLLAKRGMLAESGARLELASMSLSLQLKAVRTVLENAAKS